MRPIYLAHGSTFFTRPLKLAGIDSLNVDRRGVANFLSSPLVAQQELKNLILARPETD